MLYGAVPGFRGGVSRLVLGTLTFRPENIDVLAPILDRFVAAGGNALDTAQVYEGGASEQALGLWLSRRGSHDDLLVITKGAHHHADGTPRVSSADIDEDLRGSLGRLGIQRIDMYMLHRDDPASPVEPIVEALNDHVAAGRIGAIGASNWTHPRIAAANDYALRRGLRPFVASSPNLALAVPNKPFAPGTVSIAGDREALTWYQRTQLPVLAWSAGASGFFSGRFTPAVPPNPSVEPYYGDDGNWARLERVRQLAAARGCTPTQVALAWVLHQPFPTFALIGPRTLEELDDCLGALDVSLTTDEVAWLDNGAGRGPSAPRARSSSRLGGLRTSVGWLLGRRRPASAAEPPDDRLRLRFGLHIPEYPSTRAGNEWETVAAQARAAEEVGFDSLSLPDHFMWVRGDPANPEPVSVLECFTALGGIAAVTRRIKIGAMVAGVPYRNPALLAKIVSTLDNMSGGRAIYGVGAAWAEHEFRGYGWEFESIGTRMERLEEAVQVALRLWTERPASFAGRHYRLDGALCDPPAAGRARIPIMVAGSGEKMTLRIAAKYADYCNVMGEPATVAHKFAVLRDHCAAVGRDFGGIRRTVTSWVLLGRDEADLAAKQARFAGKLPGLPGVQGTPEQVIERLREYQRAGADDVMLLIPDAHDVEPIRLFGEVVISRSVPG